MQVPLEVAFHNIESSDWAETEIRATRRRSGENLRPADVVPRPRRPAGQQRAAAPFRRWSISSSASPAATMSWSAHEPDHLMRKYQRPDLHKAINEAFRIAERRLHRHQGAARRPHQGSASRRAEPGAGPDRRNRSGRRVRISAHQGRRPALFPSQRDAVGKFRRPETRPRGVLRRQHGRHRSGGKQGPGEANGRQRRRPRR